MASSETDDRPDPMAPVHEHELGPDPEPEPGRLARQIEQALHAWRNEFRRQPPTPQQCPLDQAFGEIRPCDADCDYLHVPGHDGCVVAQWEPEVQNNRELAAWFIAIRARLAASRDPGDTAGEAKP